MQEEPEPSIYNCGVCGDRVSTASEHHCWAFEKIQEQENLREVVRTDDYTGGSEDVVARMKLQPQYPNYS